MKNYRKIRMKRWANPAVSLDLEPGDVVELPAGLADQFIANDMADPVEEDSADLEVAALRPGRRRG